MSSDRLLVLDAPPCCIDNCAFSTLPGINQFSLSNHCCSYWFFFCHLGQCVVARSMYDWKMKEGTHHVLCLKEKTDARVLIPHSLNIPLAQTSNRLEHLQHQEKGKFLRSWLISCCFLCIVSLSYVIFFLLTQQLLRDSAAWWEMMYFSWVNHAGRWW